MQKAISMISLLILLATPFAWCDNEAGGTDMPWGDDPSNGVEEISCDSALRSPKIYYDLQGRKVDNPQSGKIYIVNGKKILFTK